MKYRVFEPRRDRSPSAPHIAPFTIIMPGIIGETLQSTGPLESTQSYRASRAAELLGVHVIGLERPAELDATETGHLARHLAHLTTAIGQPVMLAAVSANGPSALRLAQTELLPIDAISLFDPIGQKQQSGRELATSWLLHQTRVEPSKPAKYNNKHPLQGRKPWQQLAAARSIGLFLSDTAHQATSYRSTETVDRLVDIANNPYFAQTTVQTTLVGHTFTATPDETSAVAERLNRARNTEDAAPFTATVEPELYHSWTDDPFRLATWLGRCIKNVRELG